MENQVKSREWVKTAAIIFLALLLVLTFFSNTILNASLTSVSAKQVGPGSIKARITGSGTVSANESYDVTINQTRKVASIKVKVGKEVSAGDVMFVLEAEDSEELKKSQEELIAMQLAYDKAMMEAGNTAAKDNHEVEKAQKAYDEAVRIYNQYSSADPSQIAVLKAQASARLKDLQSEKSKADKAVTEAKKPLTEAQSLVTERETLKKSLSELEYKVYDVGAKKPDEDLKTLEGKRDKIREEMNASLSKEPTGEAATRIKENLPPEDQDKSYAFYMGKYEKQYKALLDISGNRIDMVDMYCQLENDEMLKNALTAGGYTDSTGDVRKAYYALHLYYSGKDSSSTSGEGQGYYFYEEEIKRVEAQIEYANVRDQLENVENEIRKIIGDLELGEYENYISRLEDNVDHIQDLIDAQQEAVDDLSSAESAAATVKSTKQALEDLLFNKSLGNSGYLDVQDQKRKIEEKEKEIEKLIENADEVEVLAKVSGVVSAVNVTAGKTVGAEETMATINLTDRGYTVKIPVTAEQSKRVSVGDVATISNLWNADITATLESISPDPNSKSNGKLLVFRLTGDVTPDQNLTLSIGQKSQNFDALVPNAAVRDDANGKYVLVLTVKKTPLNDRYVAKRVDIQVLGSDDNSSAVSGLNNGDFVITSSAKPVAAGDEVRLAESAG